MQIVNAAIAPNREGTLIASSSADRTVKLWDINTRELLQTLQGHTYWAHLAPMESV
ncbi:WD40 repeat domain-containing protein [Pseudanabaena sp. PCC 6802]|uniref:WD40 repeat domain-containing protein n=1 Tax=Pseudanabaena sp. PCC 6802 TaxID=118173 RepID=UPI00034CB469|nr:hypothetical protein [Pseudanabaena sp. PCC 6802]